MKKYLPLIIGLIIITGVFIWLFLRSRSHRDEGVGTLVQQEGTTPQALEEPKTETSTKSLSEIKNNMYLITLKTNLGEIQFETYDSDAPKAVANFITLAKRGFYDGVMFHRVIKDFMIQGGDPSGNGTGGPGYTFEDELDPNTASAKAGYQKGVVAMANAGPNTNGSQFFIMLKDTPLPHNYTIFGKVIKGQDVVDAIGQTKTDKNDKPLSPMAIKSVTVEAKN